MNLSMAQIIRMQAEIDELRAALKAQPVQPAPLTDEQIKEMSETIWGSELDYKHEAEIKFARAIEAARTGGAG